MAAIKSSKAALRKEIKARLSSLASTEKHKQSANVLEKLFQLPVYKESQRISVYLSTDNEVNTEGIVRDIFENNKQCFVPRYTKTTMEMVKLRSVDDWANLPLTKWNIKQPALTEKRESATETGGLDLIIIPGVAFTRSGHRLGHGAGYYDKFLVDLKQNQPFSTVALAFNEQMVEELPVEPSDVPIDFVLYSSCTKSVKLHNK